MNKTITIFLALSIILAGCIDSGSGKRTSKGDFAQGGDNVVNLPKDKIPDETNLNPGENNSGNLPPKVILNSIVDPSDGSYKTKITLSKNYSGILYLSGLNIHTLKDRIIYVRFRFGRELEALTFQGTIARGSGITPEIAIDSIIIDLGINNFSSIRTLYDLYDYSSSDTEKLYCRGLKLEYDPTFISTVGRKKCNYTGAKCLYSYASIIDSGLYNYSGLTERPSLPMYDTSGNGFNQIQVADVKKRCLPDSKNISDILTSLGPLATQVSGNSIGAIIGLSGDTNYIWNGPFRSTALSDWEISGNAVFGENGIFTGSIDGSYNPDTGFGAKLYPREGQLSLQSGIEYIGSTKAFGIKSKKKMLLGGDSTYMNGCNLRVVKPNIGRCNVSADIEVYYIGSDGKEVSLTKNVSLKVQLIEKENTISNPRVCSNDQNCGNGECCFNNRCFEKNLVGGTCQGDIDNQGNGKTGDSCSGDLDCSSLCCNYMKRCDVHINDGSQKVLCSKNAGESCISKQFCKEYYIPTYYKIKTGIIDGKQTCAIRVYQVPTFGDCINFRCQVPTTPSVPYFNPDNPDCRDAVDAPTSF